MKTGVVKWFNNAKGYGFILSDEGGHDVFAHYSSITMDGYRTLRAGQCVAFDAIDGPKGLHAMSITILEEVTVTGVNSNSDETASNSNEATTNEDELTPDPVIE
jgi:CspA family cold shock protein